MDDVILETDVDDTQCFEQIVDIRPLKLFATFHYNVSRNESSHRSLTCKYHRWWRRSSVSENQATSGEHTGQTTCDSSEETRRSSANRISNHFNLFVFVCDSKCRFWRTVTTHTVAGIFWVAFGVKVLAQATRAFTMIVISQSCTISWETGSCLCPPLLVVLQPLESATRPDVTTFFCRSRVGDVGSHVSVWCSTSVCSRPFRLPSPLRLFTCLHAAVAGHNSSMFCAIWSVR